MRLEATNRADSFHVWMSNDEFDTLRRAALTPRDDILLRLGGTVGLRAFEIPQICPIHVKREGDGTHYRLRVPKGKDTANGTGKPRDAYLPANLERDLYQYRNLQQLAETDPFIDLSTRGVRAAVDRIADRAAKATGDKDFRHVSSHDLRRRFAQRLLVEKNMNPRVVMAVGGWSSFKALEPYLNAPTADVVNEAFEEAGLV